MNHRLSSNRPTSPRSGFTLIELLVVIGVIVFLITMTVSVVNSVITTSREKRTIATIRKVDSLLTDRMEAFTMGLKSQKLTGTDLKSIHTKKSAFKRYFPQTLAEAGLADTDDPADPTASSEALYEFLVNGESFGAPSVDLDAFDSQEVSDTDGDGRPEFLDGWGRPLRFYRWPTRLIRAGFGNDTTDQSFDSDAGTYGLPIDPQFNPPQKTGYDARLFFGSMPPQAELGKDPGDPLGLINAGSMKRLGFADVAAFENAFHTPETWSLPLIVSAGADGILGLYEPSDKANKGHLAQPRTADPVQLDGVLDNFSNRNLTR